MNIFVSCGEPSGDVYAGSLINALKERMVSEIWGMLGPKGISSGGEAVWGYEALHLMGITEVLPAIPRLFKLRAKIVKEILARAPECVIVIDSPDFHLPVIKKLRSSGYCGKIVYLVTPTVWAWRAGRAKILRELCDLCLPLFSFEHEWLLNRGINSAWIAHPLVEIFRDYAPSEELKARFAGKRIIAFMPGSRAYAIRWHMDALVESAHRIKTFGFSPVFSVAPGLYGGLREKLLSRLETENLEYCENDGRDLLAVSEAAAGVSGTISIEAMLLKRFMVVVYNGNFLSWLVWKLFIHTPFMSIPNILSCGLENTGSKEKIVFPEIVGHEMTAENITSSLLDYLNDERQKEKTDALLSAAVLKMGQGNAAAFWAEKIGQIMEP